MWASIEIKGASCGDRGSVIAQNSAQLIYPFQEQVVMSSAFKFLDRENALALLPLPEPCLQEIEDALASINSGENGGVSGWIDHLTKINRETRLNTKSWGRLRAGATLKFVVSYSFITFEVESNSNYIFSFNSWEHKTSQAPMLMVSFDRCSGSPPANLRAPTDTYVLSRRVVSVPLQCVIKHWGKVESGHMIYEHNISPMDYAQDEFKSASYIGLTSRNWQTRYKEHQRDALTGSELLFHTTLASVFPKGGISQIGMGAFELVRSGLCLISELQYVNLTFDEAMQVEEKMVERTLNPNGLNMIPGGFAGMKFLHKLGLLKRERSTVNERDFASAKYLRRQQRPTNPAPWVTDKWQTDEYYEQVILGRKNTLSREQIQSIRKYGIEWNFSPEVIANLSGANLRQVRDVLSGKYYSRVK